MAKPSSLSDYLEARTALPALMSDVAFGEGDTVAAAARASAALATRAPTRRLRHLLKA
jgi:hypothetical protein